MKLGKIAKHIRITDKSILVVQQNSGLTEFDIHDLQRDVRKMGLDVVVVQARSIDDLVLLPEQEMARRGWFRVETLSKLAISKIKTKEGETGNDSQPGKD